jgi:alpha-D-ribose 1-methylphosphonate 5-triphosphate synthase subunit PhnH
MTALALDGGFSSPVLDGQVSFRAVMNALANPGAPQLLRGATPPNPLSPELATIALTLCDHDTPVWLDPTLAESETVIAWLRFQTGAPLTSDPTRANFAMVSGVAQLPAFDRFALGTDEYPDRSTTIVVALPSLSGGPALTLRGPGIKHTQTMAPQGLPPQFVAMWAANRALFPRGVDLLLVADGQVIGLPRSTRIEEG